MTKQVDHERRKLLTSTATVLGGLGVTTVGLPIAASMRPSEKTKALGVDVAVDISNLKPGEMRTVRWRRQPVLILRRTPEMLQDLELNEHRLKDPQSEYSDQQPETTRNRYRSINPEYLVLMGVCPHLGCTPRFNSENDRPEQVGGWWKGGFICPCHNSAFDASGRVFAGRPSPLNLPVPPHFFLNDTTLVIGDLSKEPVEPVKPV